MKSQALSFEHKPLIVMGDALEGFIELLNLPAVIKDASTALYRVCNIACANMAGLKPEEQVGLTVHEFGGMLKLPLSVTEKIAHIDQQIFNGIMPGSLIKKHYLIQDGSVIVEKNIKKPIVNGHNKVVATFEYSHDMTPYCHPTYLFLLYEKYYSIKEAIQKFLHYFKLDVCFYKLPTRRELLTLLTLRENSCAKYAANLMKISERTVEEYKARLRTKLSIIGLDEVLVRLRKHHEYEDLES